MSPLSADLQVWLGVKTSCVMNYSLALHWSGFRNNLGKTHGCALAIERECIHRSVAILRACKISAAEVSKS